MVVNMIARGLKSSPRFLAFFVFNLAIGLMGLTAIEVLKSSFQGEVALKSKSILGSDLSIGARRAVDNEKLEKLEVLLPKDFKKTKVLSLFSMASRDTSSALVNVRVVGESFPFYGEIKTSLANGIRGLNSDEIVIYPELKYQLQVEVGDVVQLGVQSFKIKGLVIDDGQQNFSFGSLAPRIYMTQAGLKGANLIQKGSTAWRSYHYKFASKDYEALRKKVVKVLDDPSLRINTAKSSSRQVGRVLSYLNDFLGLVSLSGLFLAGLGLIFLYKSFLHQRRKDVAIFKFLGMKKKQIFRIYFGELLVLGFLGSLVGLALGYSLLPILLKSIESALEIAIPMKFEAIVVGVIISVGVMSTLVMAPPLIGPYMKTDYKLLFSHEEEIHRRPFEFLLFIPLLLFYWGLAIYLSKSIFSGTLFILVLSGMVGLVFAGGTPILNRLSGLGEKGGLAFRLAIKYLTRFKGSTLVMFTCLSICSMLMTLIPQLRSTLLNEVRAPDAQSGPVFFLFDIQPEQRSMVEQFFNDHQLKVLNMSPMVQARLMKVNGTTLTTKASAGLTREEEREIRMRNRGVNLSYRNELLDSEELVDGMLPTNSYNFESNPVAEITLEQRYATRLDVGIGDQLEFDILGMPVLGKIVGIRAIRWTSFMPNFFISFGQGVLEDAPKTYLAAIGNPKELKLPTIQAKFSKKFSNVSVIDVRRLMKKISGVIDSMSQVLISMALVTLLVGLLVIFSLVSHQIYRRSRDISLLKVLGLKTPVIQKSLSWEMVVVALSSVTLGSLLSTSLVWVLSKQVFFLTPQFRVSEVFLISGAIVVVSTMINIIGSRQQLKRKPSQVFSEGEA